MDRAKLRQVQTVSELADLIEHVCLGLLGHCHDAEMGLMVGTAVAESGLRTRRQGGNGPARGLWQMEPETCRDVFVNYLAYRPKRLDALVRVWLGMPSMAEDMVGVWYPEMDVLEWMLEHDDVFACALTRLNYLRDPEAIPETLEGQAAYWKQYHNTSQGKGTAEHYRRQWHAHRCDMVLKLREAADGNTGIDEGAVAQGGTA